MDLKLLRTLVDYSPETGLFFWKPRPESMFSAPRHAKAWNSRYAGLRADRPGNVAGYLRLTLFDRKYYAHRVAWALSNGEVPDADLHIDHINKDKTDNRAANLRCVSASVNHRNSKRQANNKSGVTGVCWIPDRAKWLAYARVNRRHKHLGYYDSMEEAAHARLAFSKDNGFSSLHGDST